MILLSFSVTFEFLDKALDYLGEDGITKLELHLCGNPTQGKVIQGSGGIRKLRWASKDKGKRGGFRVIYYFVSADDRILLLDIYSKSVKTDLTKNEVKELAAAVKAILDS